MAKPVIPLPGDPLAAVALNTLYVLGGLLGLSLGIINPIISILMEHRGVSGLLNGANASLFFLCVALLAPLVGRQLSQVGLKRTLAVGLSAYAAAIVIFPWLDEPVLWFALRGLMGIGMACAMIGAQTGLSAFAGPERRALVNGVYGLCFGVGLGVGPILATYLYGLAVYLPFAAAGLFLFQAAGLALLGLPSAAHPEADRPMPGLLRYTSVPVFAVLAYGFAEATLLTMYPAFLVRIGLAPLEIAHRIAAFVIGGVVGTLPLCYLGDRIGHRQILLACSVGGVAALVGVTEADSVCDLMNLGWTQLGLDGSPVSVGGVGLVAAFAVGFTLGPVFALALALLAELLPKAKLPAGSALFTAAFSVGSAAGPWLSAWLMHRFGDRYLFTASAALFGILVLVQLLVWLRTALGAKRSVYAVDAD